MGFWDNIFSDLLSVRRTPITENIYTGWEKVPKAPVEQGSTLKAMVPEGRLFKDARAEALQKLKMDPLKYGMREPTFWEGIRRLF